MSLQLPPELLFPTGAPTPLPDAAVEGFLSYARKIHSESGRKHIFEEFKRAFSRVSGEPYYPSSSESWAESDFSSAAMKAAQHAPGFIQAYVEACEALENAGAVVPAHSLINHVLSEHAVPFRIENGELISSSNFVAPPDAPDNAASIASMAFSEAAGLVRTGHAPSAVDRIHTALHAFLRETCESEGIEVGNDPTITQIFKLLREHHPAFQPAGPRSDDIARILRSFASVVDAMSPIRNKASMAHANPLLEGPEAIVVVNAAYTILRYAQDRLGRYRAGAI